MPPRRRTFYLADATVLSNSKVRRLTRLYPDDWLSAWGAFHILVGVATLNGSPKLNADDMMDTLGQGNERFAGMLQEVGLMTSAGIDPATFKEWCPKPRPKYPSDYGGVRQDSGGVTTDSGGVGDDYDGIEHRSDRTPPESPTSSTSSSSTTKISSPSRVARASGQARGSAPRGAAALVDMELPEHLRAVNES